MILTMFFITFEQTYIDITPQEAIEMIKKDKNVVILDVRTKEEFSSGHIK